MRSLFRRFVELGRICLINYGPDYGKLCVIIDVIDHNRVLIDGPSTINGIKRQQYNLKRLSLTNFKINIPKGARVRTVEKAYKKANIQEKWKKTSWAKKLHSREVKDNLTDFQRFAVMMAKKKLNGRLAKQVNKLFKIKRKNKKAQRKAAAEKPKEQPKAVKKDKKNKPKLTKEEKAARKAKSTPEARSQAIREAKSKKRKEIEDWIAKSHERLVKRRTAYKEKRKQSEGGAKAQTKKEKPKKTRTEKGRAKVQRSTKVTEAPKDSKTEA